MPLLPASTTSVIKDFTAVYGCIGGHSNGEEWEIMGELASSSGAPSIVCIADGTAEFPRNSEASVVELQDGSLLIVWQQFLASEFEGEDTGPSRIVSAISQDNGLTWSRWSVLLSIAPGDVSVFSPSLLRLQDGSILLSYMRYHELGGDKKLSSYYAQKSTDEGRSFSEPVTVWSRRPWGTASHVTKQLRCGRLLAPAERVTYSDGGDHSTNGVLWSDDNGATWRGGEYWIDLPLRGAMEPAVEELSDGRILMVMRTQLGAVFASVSEDRGETWSPAQTTGVASPESCPELIRIPQTGDLLLVWNGSPYEPNFASHYGKRSPLSVAISCDDGTTWINRRNIEVDANRAFSNPACTVTASGKVILTYWHCPYYDSGFMNVRRLGLNAAVFDVGWLYS